MRNHRVVQSLDQSGRLLRMRSSAKATRCTVPTPNSRRFLPHYRGRFHDGRGFGWSPLANCRNSPTRQRATVPLTRPCPSGILALSLMLGYDCWQGCQRMAVWNQNPGIGESDLRWRRDVQPRSCGVPPKTNQLARIESRLRCAKAELASSPEDVLLADFIRLNEALLAKERAISKGSVEFPGSTRLLPRTARR